MKKKSLAAIILVLVTFCAYILPVGATDVMPIMEHCNACAKEFSIYDGYAYVSVAYEGVRSSFSSISISVKLQKRFLGIFWSTVDIGYPDDVWTFTSTDYSDFIEQSFPISEAGTYRAVFEIKIYGTDGTFDTIEDKRTYEYNG